MQITVREVAHFLDGKIDGNPDAVLTGPSKIEEGSPGSITFLSNPKYEKFIYNTNASAVLVNTDFKPNSEIRATLIRVENVNDAIAQLLHAFNGSNEVERVIDEDSSIDPTVKLGNNVAVGKYAVISEGAEIGKDVIISPQVFIGKNVKIGAGTHLYPGVKIMHDCILGQNCIIHSNTVIGSDGFGFNSDKNGRFQKIPQVGNVVIGNEVEIGSNTVIDRATMGSTKIDSGVKMDNLIQVAHNVTIGENTVIAAQVGIAGSSKIGKNCMLGGQVGVAGHIAIADETKIAAQSGINHTITEKGTTLFGSPAISYNQFLKSYVGFKKLPNLMKQVQDLEKELEKLKGNLK